MILVKLGLGKKFLRVILYIQQNQLGIWLIKPKTVIAILVCKLCIRNKRVNSKLAKLIRINEELVAVEYGRRSTNNRQERIINNRLT